MGHFRRFLGYAYLNHILEPEKLLTSTPGSTLALAYAEKHPERCLGLILRGIFTVRKEELAWNFQHGSGMLFPDAFAKFRSVIPEEEWGDLMGAYHKRLTGEDEEERLKWWVRR